MTGSILPEASLTSELIFWVITGIVGLLITILLILFQRNLKAQTEQMKATNLLSETVKILEVTMGGFQINCGRIEDNNVKRLDDHSKSIKRLNGSVTKHGTMIGEHTRRIRILESDGSFKKTGGK